MSIVRRITILTATAALIAAFTATPASADFSVFGSYWDADVAGEAIGGGIGWEIPVGEFWGVDLRASWLTDAQVQDPFDVDDPEDIVEEHGDLNMAPVDAGLRFNFNPTGNFRPFVGGGATFLFLDLDDDARGTVEDEFGWYASAGAKVGDGVGVDFLAEVLYRGIEATFEDELDLREDVAVDLDGPAVNLGIIWNF